MYVFGMMGMRRSIMMRMIMGLAVDGTTSISIA